MWPHPLYARLKNRPDYVVVIPSRGRASGLFEKTIPLLLAQRITKNRIEVWVAPDERSKYQRAIEASGHSIRLCVGVAGIAAQRRTISESHPAGKHIVSIDDDIDEPWCKEKFDKRDTSSIVLTSRALPSLIHHAFDLMQRNSIFIWGLSYTQRHDCLSTHISHNCSGLPACLYGYVNRHDKDLYTQFSDVTDDWEHMLRYYEVCHGWRDSDRLCRRLVFAMRGFLVRALSGVGEQIQN